jgi:hypothetical protein
MPEERIMTIDAILKDHQNWLDQARQALGAKAPAKPDIAVLTAPLDAKRQLVDGLTARIANLTQQKDAAVKQYDAAIADAKGQQARLQNEIAADEKLLKPVASPEKPVALARTKRQSDKTKKTIRRPR